MSLPACSACVTRRWELLAARDLSVHAGRSGHGPRASESPPWRFERDRHWRLQGSLPGGAAPVPGVHSDRTPVHHDGMIRLNQVYVKSLLHYFAFSIYVRTPDTWAKAYSLSEWNILLPHMQCRIVYFMFSCNSSSQIMCTHPSYFPTHIIFYGMPVWAHVYLS